jgi:hypothetical protein
MYFSLARWWLNGQQVNRPSSLILSTDNNPFGYDWIWASFDNNWSLFYGNLMFWIMSGPAVGILYLEKNGTYLEFSDIEFRYEKMAYNEEFDVYYPLEMKVTAKKDAAQLYLHFIMTAEVNEYIDRYKEHAYWRGLGLWESPGIVEGYYVNAENNNISLRGVCEIEPQRLFSPLGHNSIEIKLLREYRGIYANITLNACNLEIVIEIKLLPNPVFYVHIRRIEK